MNDMAQTIIPKSDQLNADDLIAGPITIKITGVTIRSGQEQPISIHFEGDNGKPYKACKSMCRVMVNAWGADSKKYVGRSLTLYRDPSVKWGGMDVGGIRISHMSDIDGAMTMALTMTKSNRKPFTVKPLVAPKESEQLKAALFAIRAMHDKASREAAKELAQQLEGDDLETASAAYSARIAELKKQAESAGI